MIEDINQKTTKLRKEIQLLNTSLKDLNIKKETKYNEKDILDAKLNSLIKAAKALKEQKQILDDKITEFKKQRDAKNRSAAKLLADLQNLKKEKRDQLRKNKVPSISEIHERIKQIEFIIQTQAVSFDREKKYMDEIKRLKVKEKEIAELEKGFKDISDLRKKVETEKAGADKLHKTVQDMAATNSQLFDELTKKSREIAEIKEQRSTAIAFLRTAKLNMNVLNKKLNAMLRSWSTITHKSISDLARKGSEMLQKRTEEVKEKFKKKEKLTTDDILLLQREAIAKDRSNRTN